jgi:hypothetical protein
VVGGAVFVAGMYWLGSPESRAARAALRHARAPAHAADDAPDPALAPQPA